MSETITPDEIIVPDNVEYLFNDGRCLGTSKTTGERCRRKPIAGGTVCYMHGGNAPQVQEAAYVRIRRTRDYFLQALHNRVEEAGEALDPKVLLDGVERLTKLTELLEGRATERKEATIIKTEEVREEFKALMDQVAERAG